MKGIKFVFILSALLVIFGCNQKKALTLKPTLPFPVIVDKLKDREAIFFHEKWLNTGNHLPYYFGVLTDTIYIGGSIYPRFNRITELNNTVYSKKSEVANFEFAEYFPDPWEYKDCISPDSINLLVRIDTSQAINNRGFKSYPAIIHNLSKDTVFIGLGSEILLVTEALTRKGEWKPIEEPFKFFCGTGLQTIILPPNKIVVTSELIYSGDFKTQLRLRIGKSISKVFYGSINESQFSEQPSSY